MISLRDSYEINVARPENAKYRKLVLQLVEQGQISDRYSTWLTEADIYTIVCLAMIWLDEQGRPYTKESPDPKLRVTEFSNVFRLFSTMSEEIQERMLWSFGLDFIILNALGSRPGFGDVITKVSERLRAQQIQGQQTTPPATDLNIKGGRNT